MKFLVRRVAQLPLHLDEDRQQPDHELGLPPSPAPRPQLPQHARQRPRRVILLLHGEGHLHEDGEMGNEGAEKPTHKLAIHGAREAWI